MRRFLIELAVTIPACPRWAYGISGCDAELWRPTARGRREGAVEMSKQRDPRIDPAPGDGIARDFSTALGGTILREVTRAHGGIVAFRRDNGYVARYQIVSLDKWRSWARRATVFAIAGEDAA